MKMKKFPSVLVCILSIFACQEVMAQEQKNPVDMFQNWSQLLSPEKVYLHTDKDVYFATDTI